MLYLYIDEQENRLHCVSNKPIANGHYLNQLHHLEVVVPDDFVYKKPVYDAVHNKNTVEDMTAQEILNKITYSERRAVGYPSIQNQLDMLYHDIDSGLFGDQAKTSKFYTTIKAIKETYPIGS
jgi:hypothetical protein